MLKLSASRIETFLNCKYKYWLSYEKKVKKQSSVFLNLGNACHEALEAAGHVFIEKGKLSAEDIAYALEVYDTLASKYGISNPIDFKHGRDMVEGRLADFKIGDKIVGLEVKFGMDYDKDSLPIDVVTKYGVPLIGAIDKAVEVDDETLLVIDYKTYRLAPTHDELRHNIQLSLYDIAARIIWPNYKRVILLLDMLNFNDIQHTYRTDEEREHTEKLFKIWYDLMDNFEEKDAVPTIHEFCSYCDYKYMCEAYKEYHSNISEFIIDTPIEDMNDGELSKEYIKLTDIKKVVDGRQKMLKAHILERINQNNSKMATDEFELFPVQKRQKNYNVDEIIKNIPKSDIGGLVNLKTTKLRKYVEQNPYLKKVVEGNVNVNYTSPYVSKRKITK